MLQASHTVASCKSLYYAKNRNQRSSDDIAFWKYVDPDYLKGCLEKYAHVVFARNVLDAEDDDDGDDDDGDDDDDDDDEEDDDDDDDDDDDGDDDDDDDDDDNDENEDDAGHD